MKSMKYEKHMRGPSVHHTIKETIAGGLEDPFYVVEVEDILRKHKNWLHKMPRIRPFYAVKCNQQPIMLETLAALGIGFDCASKAEIDTVLSMGVLPSNIIYANPCKTRSYIKHAAENSVDLMTFDNVEELYKVAALHPKARLILRLKVDDSHSVCRFSMKFGADPAKAHLLLEEAKRLELNVVGISFHVGSGCESASSFSDAISDARRVFDIGLRMGFDMNILDIGGGFPGTSDPRVSFDEIAFAVNQALDKHFPAVDDDGQETKISIIAEPGRYYAASAFTLVANVIAKRVQDIPEEGRQEIMYYLNDGVYGSFNCIIFDHWDVHPKALLSSSELLFRQYYPSVVWGPTCDSMDCIKRDVILPEMEVGEWLYFPEMGAYTIAAASNFNGFQIPTVKYNVTPQIMEILRHLPSWPRIAKVLDVPVMERSFAVSMEHPVGGCIPVH